jgi:hypothetical protein
MSVTITAADPRSIAALALTVRAGGWARCHLRDGSKFYGVPSRTRPGLVHLTDTQSCSCPDFKYRGQACAHILAVRLHCEQVKAKAALEAGRRGRHSPEQVAAGSALYAELYSEAG